MNQIIEIFSAAIEIPSQSEREKYVIDSCGSDSELLQQVQELLAAHYKPGDFLNTVTNQGPSPGLESSSSDDYLEAPGTMIGKYKLLQKIGEGGFGIVWMAEQREPIKRRVALKIIRHDKNKKQIIGRFEAERQALALMDHPNIAKVLEAGETESGRPYFVMELVRGIHITDYCNQEKLDTSAKIELFLKICHAIQHAHQKGIIHRDIKPSNILVTMHDGVPIPKVIDFGIAKATQQELTDITVFTEFFEFMGTPAYMSPEQAEMSCLDVDTRTDIYSLGVLLYELLTGTPPFSKAELMSSGFDAMRKMIREIDPIKPSTRLTQNISNSSKPNTVHGSPPKLASDLDWIILKCLEKDRTRRYGTADGLSSDLLRHVHNEPIIARPPTTIYKIQKAWSRNKLTYSAAIAVFLSLGLGILVSLRQTKLATNAQEIAEDAQKKAEERRNQVEIAQTITQSINYAFDMLQANEAFVDKAFLHGQNILSKYDNNAFLGSLRGWEWRYLKGNYKSAETMVLGDIDSPIHAIDLSADDRMVIAASRESPGIHIFDMLSVTSERIYAQDTRISKVAAHPSKNLVAFSGHNDALDHFVYLLDLDSGQIKWSSKCYSNVAMAFSRQGELLICLETVRKEFREENANVLRIYSTATGSIEKEHNLTGRSDFWWTWHPMAVSPNGKQCVYSTSMDGMLRSVSLDSGEESWSKKIRSSDNAPPPAKVIQYTEDGLNILVNSKTGLMVLDALTGDLIRRIGGPGFLELLSDSKQKNVISSRGQTLSMWDFESGSQTGNFIFDAGTIQVTCKSKFGNKIVVGTGNGQIHVIDPKNLKTSNSHIEIEGDFIAWNLNPEATQLIGVRRNGEVRLWAYPFTGVGQVLLEIKEMDIAGPHHGNDILTIARNNKRIAYYDRDASHIQVWSMPEAHLESEFPITFDPVATLEFCHGDNQIIAIPRTAQDIESKKLVSLQIINLNTGTEVSRLINNPTPWLWGKLNNAYLFPGGNHILIDQRIKGLTHYSQLQIYQIDPWKLIEVQDKQPASNKYCPVANMSETMLAFGGAIYSLPSLKPSDRIELAIGSKTAAFSPEGKRLALLPPLKDNLLQLWDVTTTRPLIELKTFQNPSDNPELKFSDDGNILAYKGAEKIELWIAPPESEFDNWVSTNPSNN